MVALDSDYVRHRGLPAAHILMDAAGQQVRDQPQQFAVIPLQFTEGVSVHHAAAAWGSPVMSWVTSNPAISAFSAAIASASIRSAPAAISAVTGLLHNMAVLTANGAMASAAGKIHA